MASPHTLTSAETDGIDFGGMLRVKRTHLLMRAGAAMLIRVVLTRARKRQRVARCWRR